MTLKEKFKAAKEYVGKLIQTHAVMMLFGMMVYLPIGVETPTRRTVTLIIGVITMLFYYYLIDLFIWDKGAQDAIRVRSGTQPTFVLKGFLAGLLAAIPDFILGLLHCIFYINREYKGFGSLNTVFTLITRTWEGAFTGFERAVFGTGASASDTSFVWFYLITPFIAAAFAEFSYYCGTKEFTIIPRPKKVQK